MMNQLPDPTYLRNSIQLIEAKISLRQSACDSWKELGEAQANYDAAEIERKRASNHNSKAADQLANLMLLRAREWQTRLAVMQVDLQEMIAQRDTWKELLKQAEPQLIAPPNDGRIVEA